MDAHDGSPVPGASIALERRGFATVVVVSRTVADETGAFTLEAVEVSPGDHLAVEGRLHSRMSRAAPPFGILDVALVSRRRAVLSALVRWARRKGPPFHLPPETTPEHVMRVAADSAATARWAHAVERVAFGPGEVDARVETEVTALGHPDTEDR